jgi:hypothetical protein
MHGKWASTYKKRGMSEMARARTHGVWTGHLMFALENEGAFWVVAWLSSGVLNAALPVRPQ